MSSPSARWGDRAKLPEARPQPTGHLHRVGDQLLGMDRLRQQARVVREAGAALVPPADDEVVLQDRGVPPGYRDLRHAGAAVHEEEHRLRAVLALEKHPLLDAVDAHTQLLGDGVGERPPGLVHERLGLARAPPQQHRGEERGAEGYAGEKDEHR